MFIHCQGFDMPETNTTPSETENRHVIITGERHSIRLRRRPSACILEIGSDLFHHDSAVMMPDMVNAESQERDEPFHFEESEIMNQIMEHHPDTYRSFYEVSYNLEAPEEENDRASAMSILAATYQFLERNSEYKLLVSGHCDTSGEGNYNFALSELRAKNALYLLLGERDQWVEVCQEKSKVEDYQRILKHAAGLYGWDCDPGPIDNILGDKTRNGLRSFQENYNIRFEQSIAVDGKIGRETWGAFFDVYMDDLAAALDSTIEELSSHRQIRFLDDNNRFIACGEKVPKDQPARDNYRSRYNRRVELLFFRPPYLPDLSCHAANAPFCMKSCSQAACHIYAPGRFIFAYLDPAAVTNFLGNNQDQPQFAIREIEEDLEQLYDKPDELYASEMALSEVPDANEDDVELGWAFLEPFDELEPRADTGEIHHPSDEGRVAVA
jgi:hypothetical protein